MKWAKLDHAIIAADNFTSVVVRQGRGGGHFEHCGLGEHPKKFGIPLFISTTVEASNSSALDVIQSSYYIHGPLGDENIFAVLYVSLCYGPYTLL